MRLARINTSAATVVVLLIMMGATTASCAATAARFRLSGTVHGKAIALPTNPDVGARYSLRGTGHLNIGDTTISGSLHGVGFIASGHCTGVLDLHTAVGTLHLALRSSSQAKDFALCTSYSWAVTAASGHYAGQRGTGKVHVATSRNAATISFG